MDAVSYKLADRTNVKLKYNNFYIKRLYMSGITHRNRIQNCIITNLYYPVQLYL
jgi:hypothetical protein